MKLFRSAKITKEAENSVLVIGNFDGVHLGHQSVINYARKIAKKKKKCYQFLLLNHILNVSLHPGIMGLD